MKTRSATISYFPVERPKASAAKNQSLARGLAILQSFDDITPESGIRELSRRLGLDRSIVFRLTRTLMDAGFLEQNPITQKYRIGPRAFEIGQRFTNSGPLYDTAARQMQRLHDDHGLNVYLAVRLDSIVLYLSSIESDDVVFRAVPGTRGHLHATSLGKMLLASEPPDIARNIMSKIPLPRLTPRTMTSRRALSSDVAAVRRRGYATSDGENLVGVFSVAAPIRNPHGKVVAVMSGSYQKKKMSKARMAVMIAAIQQGAEAISKSLGAPPSTIQSALSPVVELRRQPSQRKRAAR